MANVVSERSTRTRAQRREQDQVRLCEMPECTGEAIVGWGDPVRWCCLHHYQWLLRKAAEVLDRLIREAKGG